MKEAESCNESVDRFRAYVHSRETSALPPVAGSALPLLPMDYYADSAKKTWEPYFIEDAKFPDHRTGWDSLKKEAVELRVSTAGHVWNSTRSKLSLAKKLVRAKVAASKAEWSRKISTGRYQVLQNDRTEERP